MEGCELGARKVATTKLERYATMVNSLRYITDNKDLFRDGWDINSLLSRPVRLGSSQRD